MKKYYGGCDMGSTYTKCVILDEEGNIAAHTTIKSKINPSESSVIAMDETVKQVEELKKPGGPGLSHRHRLRKKQGTLCGRKYLGDKLPCHGCPCDEPGSARHH